MKSKKIINIETKSFLKTFFENTNKKYCIDPENKTYVSQLAIKPFLEDVLEAYEKNKSNYKIVGADFMKDFEINISDKKVLERICIDIWENPKEYFNYEQIQYNAVKYIWIEEKYDKDGINLYDYLVKIGHIKSFFGVHEIG